jgi:hypothetical protein
MNEQNETHEHEFAEPQEQKPLPMIRVYGEGYITRKDGTVVPFTLSNEDQ